MRRQQYISIKRCRLGFWHSLPQATALEAIGKDLFNSRIEKVYPYQRPRCIYT
jgi:hypothetical protein